jgi:hypothetical protein
VVDLSPYIEPNSGNNAVRAGRGNQGGVVTIRQLLLVIHYRHDGWVWRYSARQTTIKDFRNFDRVLGVNTDGHRYRGRRAGRNRSFEDRRSLISDCVSLGLLRTGECLRLQSARMAFICGLQARFPFGFASIAGRALIFIVTKSEQKQFVFRCNENCA